MSAHEIWRVEVVTSQDSDETTALATMRPGSGHSVRGFGASRRDPYDAFDPQIGTEIAVARALNTLAEQMLRDADERLSNRAGHAVHVHA